MIIRGSEMGGEENGRKRTLGRLGVGEREMEVEENGRKRKL